jgi:hypothetical protein
MAYQFTNKPFEWYFLKVLREPTASEIAMGLQGGMALPAGFVNQQWGKTYLAIKEIQEAIETGKIGVDTVNGIFTNSLRVGAGNTANDLNTVVGKYAKTPTAANAETNTGDLFVVGSGLMGGARSNALRVTAGGDVMGTKSYAASGADYAEMFEWADGNTLNEDRRGLFVTLDGEKIRLADSGDYIAGVVSAAPSIIGDACTDDWCGKYETDVFGARIIEDGAYRLSEGFDIKKDSNYTSRLERAEWCAVGLVGKLVVVDDGTCKVNGYCKPSKNGIATAAETGYRVMARIDDTHIKVLVK